MKRSAAHQAAVDVSQHAQRENLSYHHALVASLTNSLQRVGRVKVDADQFVWRICFSPRLRDAVIVETFVAPSGQTNTRVHWLDDLRESIRYAPMSIQVLFNKAMTIQNAEWNKEQKSA